MPEKGISHLEFWARVILHSTPRLEVKLKLSFIMLVAKEPFGTPPL